ncbi:MAG: acetamidase/formamidase family protein, partial [Chloroflexi bacterium]|nr:acetamidase/formamidase family protein [Chloroflexota bacterium]
MATHVFTPTHYYNTLGSHEPVLAIASGDHVRTVTVDARGINQLGQSVATRGNPQTGPFFVEGAEPGDVLAVRFHELRPNRPTG